jgi:hypothetical protein
LDLLPWNTRERLRDIIRKSPNPRKSLEYFQRKSEIFLGQNNGIKMSDPKIPEEQEGSEEINQARSNQEAEKWEEARQEILAEISIKQVSTPIPVVSASTLIPIDSAPSLFIDNRMDRQILSVPSRTDIVLSLKKRRTISGDYCKAVNYRREDSAEESRYLIKEIQINRPTAVSDNSGCKSAAAITRWILDPGGAYKTEEERKVTPSIREAAPPTTLPICQQGKIQTPAKRQPPMKTTA